MAKSFAIATRSSTIASFSAGVFFRRISMSSRRASGEVSREKSMGRVYAAPPSSRYRSITRTNAMPEIGRLP